jgi:integrase
VRIFLDITFNLNNDRNYFGVTFEKVLGRMPDTTAREKRDKTIFSLLCLTGIRAAALKSFKIKHVDLEEKSVTQNPREVATKFGKRIDTFFAKGFEQAEAALSDWIRYLEEVALYGPDDPLFPATSIKVEVRKGF